MAYLAETYAEKGTALASKTTCYTCARQCYRQAGARAEGAYIRKAMADLHFRKGNMQAALEELHQVLAAYRAVHYPRLHYTYDLLASVYQHLGNYKDALRHELAAVESARKTRDTGDLGLFYLKVGVFYGEQRQPEDCQRYYQLALQLFRRQADAFMTLHIASLMAGNLVDQHKPQEALDFCLALDKQYSLGNAWCQLELNYTRAICYMALHQNKLAEKYCLQAIAYQEQLLRGKAETALYARMAQFYLDGKQYAKAQRYLDKAQSSRQTLQDKATVERLLYRLQTAQGHYREALDHYRRHQRLQDSIFNTTKSQQIANLQIQYETRAKEQNIALLTKQNRLQQASIREKEFQRNSFVVSATLLLLLTGVVYNRYRLKQQSNQLLEAKQAEINSKNDALEQVLVEKDTLLEEKEWMMKEIHHRVKNNLQVVSSLLYSQAVYLRDPAARTAIRESQNRVQTMGLLHQHLYQGRGPSQVAMAPYLGDLARHLLQSFNRQESIRLELDVADVALDMTLAVPVGLLLNEALTNALKYAYAPGESGFIALHLRVQDQQCHLSLRDEGVGLPTDFDPANSPTLGWNMIQGLSQQLSAKLQITTTHGVQLDLWFTSVVRSKPAGLAAQA